MVNNLGHTSVGEELWVGDIVVYTLTVSAEGLTAERDVEVRDDLDSCLDFLAATGDGTYDATDHLAQWMFTLSPGTEPVVLYLWVKVDCLPVGDADPCPGPDWLPSNVVELDVHEVQIVGGSSIEKIEVLSNHACLLGSMTGTAE